MIEAERQWGLSKQAAHAMLYMTTLLLIVGLGLVGCTRTTHPPQTPHFESVHDGSPAKTYAFINGQWFDGQGFTQDTWYAAQGSLTRFRPESVEQTIDLKGGFIVPPFGEATPIMSKVYGTSIRS